jgi:hypothetical protein
MPLEPSPYVKKAMEALGCSECVPVEEAERVLKAFLGEAERDATRLIERGMTPMGILNAAVAQLPAVVAFTKVRALTSINAGEAEKGITASPLGKVIALIATSATMMIKDMAFVGSEHGIDGNCDKCTLREKCPKWEEDNHGG